MTLSPFRTTVNVGMNRSLGKARVHWVHGRKRRSRILLSRALRRPASLTLDDLYGIAAIAESMTGREARAIAAKAYAEIATRSKASGAGVNGSAAPAAGAASRAVR
ncbi:MAG TPA: hypothetical protein VHF22_12855, partial [Planctomycetota bacterium]|nr:hypothetical protein [Planctomycetota bacterium]